MPYDYVFDDQCEKTGLVLSANHRERSARGRRFSTPMNDFKFLGKPQELSLYNLKEHEHFRTTIGDRVLVLLDVDTSDSPCQGGEIIDMLSDGILRVALLSNRDERTKIDLRPINIVVLEEDIAAGEDGLWVDTDDANELGETIQENLEAEISLLPTTQSSDGPDVPLLPVDEELTQPKLSAGAVETGLPTEEIESFEMRSVHPPPNHYFITAQPPSQTSSSF